MLDEQLRNYVERAKCRDITSADSPLYQAPWRTSPLSPGLPPRPKSQALSATDEEINAAVKEVSEQFPTKEAFMQYLDQSGIKMSRFP